jgi:prepilin-type processing-associated H-X9-DG protein
MFGGRPEHEDPAPLFEGEIQQAGTPKYFMKQFCATNRHAGNVNALFMDASARAVGLKELYTLKWHRKYNICNKWTLCGTTSSGGRGGQQTTEVDWPEWMQKFKDY